MAIIKLNPFSPWVSNSILPFFDDEDHWPQLRVTEGLDVFETDTDVVVKAPVPGITADKVNVTFEDGVLRISAKTEESKEEKEKKKVVYRQQRTSYFDYTTTLPRSVQGDKISAEVSDGVVTVKAPIAQEAKQKRITVQTKSK